MVSILNSKLLVPDVSETISRERLDAVLEEIPRKKLTTVVAGAGYGKTTLVAQAVRNSKWKSVWYRLGETDRDLVIFLSYLVAGVKKIVPSFGEKTLQRLTNVRDPKTEWLEIMTLLIGELEKAVSYDLYIVLEDLHLVQESREISQALDFLVENLPPDLHLIVISRLEPELSLSRLRSTRELVEIKTEDLAFTDMETDLLCRELFGLSLESEGLKTLRKKTEGWVTALILFYHTAKGNDQPEIEKRITDLKGSSKVISSYLQENVFESLPEKTREFLLKTSILPRLQVDFCNTYLNMENSREILSQLETDRLFTFVLDEDKEWFCYHHLYRDFLHKKLEREFDSASVKTLQLKAAALCEQSGNTDDALDLYLSAEEYDKACALFEESINAWLVQGRHLLIHFYADRIPLHYLEKQSRHLYVQALLATYSGNYSEALKKLEVYFEHNEPHANDDTRQASLLMAVLHYESGDYLQAESELKTLLERIEPSEPITIEILIRLIFVATSLNNIREADNYYAEFLLSMEKLDILQPIEKEQLVSYVQMRKHFITDDYFKVVSFGEKTIQQSKEAGLGLNENVKSCYVLVSKALFHMGRFAEGLKKVEQGLTILEETGYDAVSPPAVSSICIAANTIGLGEIEAGIARAEEGLRYFSDRGITIWQARYHWLLSEAYWLAGDRSLAEEHIRNAIEKNPAVHHKRFFYEIYLYHIFTELGEYEEVQRFIDAGKKREISPSHKHEFLLLQAHYYWATDKRGMALRRLQEALSVMEERHIYLGLLMARPWVIALLVETVAQGKMTPYIQKTMSLPAGPWTKEGLISVSSNRDSKIRKAALELVKHLPKAPPLGLTVRLFGRFKILAGNDELADEHWKSRQAKMLFKFLVFKRAKGYTAKEILMELLWPEESPKVAGKRFHVVLAALRKTLEPDIPRGVPSSYIMREGDGYALSLGENGGTDVEEFSAVLERGRQEENREVAMGYFKQAESIYQGDFLEEDPFEDWCSQERERLRDDYLSVLTWLMDYYEDEKDTIACILYTEKYLTTDPYAEEMYRKLMFFHLQNNSPERVKQIYARCKKHLAEGLDCSVSPETERVYQQIVKKYDN
ncbi:MAG: hypothetical protein GY866_37290 [Proteobacteria bacterium]|nr:hypothetical protein [Pseudomonadota bacterium]